MADRERFVPRRVSRLTDELCELEGWAADPDATSASFRVFSRLVGALVHYEFHERQQALTDTLLAIDARQEREAGVEAGHDGSSGDDDPDDDLDRSLERISDELGEILDDANYTRVTLDELDWAMERESLIPLRFEVDVEHYDELLIARRGSRTETVDVPKWWGLRTKPHTMTVDERVVVFASMRSASWFAEHEVDPEDFDVVPGHVSLKQFQNVPRADIEMLLPSTQVRFRTIDTLMVAVPAVASGIAVLVTKLASTIGLIVLLVAAGIGLRDEAPDLDQTALVVLLGGVVTLGGFLFRQWSKLKNRRMQYLKTLSENLYLRTLGDGPGVIHTLMSTAEQQEVAEVILAYRFLLCSPGGLTVDELDRSVEEWFAATGDEVDFEVADAAAKLERFELVERGSGDGDGDVLRAVPLAEALRRLDRRWDDLFQCASSGAES